MPQNPGTNSPKIAAPLAADRGNLVAVGSDLSGGDQLGSGYPRGPLGFSVCCADLSRSGLRFGFILYLLINHLISVN